MSDRLVQSGQRAVQTDQGAFGFGQGLIGEIQGAAVVILDQEKADHLRVKFGQNFLNRKEVAQGF